MPSRADAVAAVQVAPAMAGDRAVPVAQHLLHGVALICVALVLWIVAVPVSRGTQRVATASDGSLAATVPAMLRSAAETVDVSLSGVPGARDRAVLRAMRGSGQVVSLFAPRPLTALATASEMEWRATGGTRLQIVSSDSNAVAMRDAAGLIDSARIGATGLQPKSGPVQGAFSVVAEAARASVAPLVAGAPAEARVLVLGDASWESRFLVAALEEAGWPVDAGLVLSPRVTIRQGSEQRPMPARHAVVVLLPGASPAAVSRVADFVRQGGGLIIVGDAARIGALASIRAGTPGASIDGELGAEASATPRHGLELVPMSSVASGSVVLESRDGVTAVAARRVGAGRVVQVGYANSWLWRMAGDDAAPAMHRRWWSSVLSSVVSVRAPSPQLTLAAEVDTLSAAPLASLARDLGLPVLRQSSVAGASRDFRSSLDLRWLLLSALLSFIASWTLRRWRGLV